MKFYIVFILSFFSNAGTEGPEFEYDGSRIEKNVGVHVNSWQFFLQHLPVENAPIRDYKGRIISNQDKHVAIIKYDVGDQDLQQCADALIRLRAEFLFEQKRYNEIGFHFTNGIYYSWDSYCAGIRPLVKRQQIKLLTKAAACLKDHSSLRKYLDIVYNYANTVSLEKELKTANDFAIGTVIISPGYPGHTCIIVDEKTSLNGQMLYKLAEGYMPAQSIYILSNPFNSVINPWYALKKGTIITASFQFINYSLKKFE